MTTLQSFATISTFNIVRQYQYSSYSFFSSLNIINIFMSEECLSTTSSSSSECNKRKIELCKAYIETGYCRYGQGCFFAHGIEQLLINQPILKSKECRNFHRNNQCRFGDRCNFRHETRERPSLFRLASGLREYPQIITMVNFRRREPQLEDSQIYQ